MKSAPLGAPTSPVEVTNVSKHGFWMLFNGVELFLPFTGFPWFELAPIGKLLNVELVSAHHLYWPDLFHFSNKKTIINVLMKEKWN